MVLSVDALKSAGLTTELAFSREEYEGRVAKVRASMAERGIDVLLVHYTPNFCYLYGYQSPLANWYTCLILPLEGDPIVQVIDIEVANLLVHGWDTDGVYTIDWMSQAEAPQQLVEILKGRGYANKRIGIELRLPGFSGLTSQVLRDELADAEFVDASDLTLDLRAVKSPTELAHIREAARMTDIGMEAALAAIREGERDNDIAAAALDSITRAGSEYVSVQPLVYVGAWTALTHVVAKRRTIKRGEPAGIELTSAYHRYAAPLYRTGVIGPPSDLVKRLADSGLTRLELLLENARPGRTGSEVARAVDEGMKGKDATGYPARGIAYSVGIGFPPDWVDHATYITEKHHRALEPGMVFHTPTGCRAPNQVGVWFSETMVITEDGCETLSRLPRELTIVS